MKAIIMAAGKGKRLRPITEWVPKPLLPIGGQPVIGTLLANLQAAGITNVLVVIGHLADKMRHFLGDGSSYGVNLTCREQKVWMGTAHAVMQALNFINGEGRVRTHWRRRHDDRRRAARYGQDRASGSQPDRPAGHPAAELRLSGAAAG